ncbi:MAG: CvpA family protein [Aggregatilineales bacterium]|nr:CvpA family protein [Aggregatilineales bacterium]HPV08382.1 CvpA family protein [Aggregatilineales bacterium]HQE17198.1 CvpA family protein [Aggregatilineales bacterium]
MIELAAFFWFMVGLFGVIGLMRGWVREVQVTAGVVLGMFIVEKISPWVWTVLVERTPADALAADPLGTLRRLVMLKCAILLILVFFGYQGPTVIQFATSGGSQAGRPRETIQEGILGLLIGLVNGYLIVGALWWYVHLAQYPFDWLTAPLADSASASLISALPLRWLASPWLEILVVVFFLIVIVAVI